MMTAQQEINQWIVLFKDANQLLPDAPLTEKILSITKFQNAWIYKKIDVWNEKSPDIAVFFVKTLLTLAPIYQINFITSDPQYIDKKEFTFQTCLVIYYDFLTAVTTQNFDYISQLTKALNDTHTARAHKNDIQALIDCKNRLAQNPCILVKRTDIETIISNLQKNITIPLEDTEEPIEDDEPEELIPEPFDENLIPLINEHHELKSIHTDYLQTEKTFSNLSRRKTDVVLKPLIDELEALTAQIEPNITACFQVKLPDTDEDRDYQDLLIQCLAHANHILIEAIKKRQQLHIQIQKRCAFIYPKTVELPILRSLSDVAIDTLKDELTTLLSLVIEIKTQTHFTENDKNTFKNPIDAFTTQLNTALALISAPSDSRTNLSNRILKHLGLKKRWGKFFNNKELLPYEITPLVEALFATNPNIKDPVEFYQQRIAEYYNIIAIIGLSPIKHMLNYATYLQTEKNQYQLRINGFKDCITQSTQLLAVLPPLLKLTDNLSTHSTVIFACETQSNITTTHNTLICLQEEIETEITRINTITDKLQRFDSITTLEQHTLNTLKNFKETLNELEQEAQKTTNNLKSIYNHNKTQILNDVKINSNDLTQGLSYADENDKKQMLIFTNACNDFVLQSNLDDSIPLSALADVHQLHLQNYNAYLADIKKAIHARIFLPFQQVHIKVYPHTKIALLPGNPYALDNKILSIRETEEQAYTTLTNTIAKLDALKGIEIPDWSSCLSTNAGKLMCCTAERETIEANATIINARLQNQTYIDCIKNLQKLINECSRIINEYIDDAINKNPDNEGLIKIKQEPAWLLTLSESELKDQIENLNLIDKRLYRILNIILQFNQLNQRYINLDPRLCDDDSYLAHLISHVDNFLSNNHMEDLSDGKRYQSIQYTRKHILKPLTAFYFKMIQRLSGDKSDDITRVTPFACRTEKEFINCGNEMKYAFGFFGARGQATKRKTENLKEDKAIRRSPVRGISWPGRTI